MEYIYNVTSKSQCIVFRRRLAPTTPRAAVVDGRSIVARDRHFRNTLYTGHPTARYWFSITSESPPLYNRAILSVSFLTCARRVVFDGFFENGFDKAHATSQWRVRVWDHTPTSTSAQPFRPCLPFLTSYRFSASFPRRVLVEFRFTFSRAQILFSHPLLD